MKFMGLPLELRDEGYLKRDESEFFFSAARYALWARCPPLAPTFVYAPGQRIISMDVN